MRRPLGRAWWVVEGTVRLRCRSAHCLARWAARSSQAVLPRAPFVARAAPGLGKPADSRLSRGRSVLIPLLRHPLSSGFSWQNKKFFISENLFFGWRRNKNSGFYSTILWKPRQAHKVRCGNPKDWNRTAAIAEGVSLENFYFNRFSK